MNGTNKKKPARVYGKKKTFNKYGMLPDSSPVAQKTRPVVEQDDSESEEKLSGDEVVEETMKGLYGKGKRSSEDEVEGTEVVDEEGQEGQEDGVDDSSSDSATIDDKDMASTLSKMRNEGEKKDPSTTVVIASTPSTLDSITAALDTLDISRIPTTPPSKKTRAKEPRSSRKTRGSTRATPPPPLDKRLEWLTPLLDAYEGNGNPRPIIKDWDSVLDPSWSLLKIAESSYAEVYKVSNPSGTSILKVMALKPPSGPGSRRETACSVESVISEVLIMDLMADIPGYLVFRDMHLISGPPPKSVIQAWEAHDWGVSLLDDEGEETNEGEANSTFPHPAKYNKEAVFLVLELGDAGIDIEHFVMKSMAELWDTLLGIVLALATGEEVCGFEHRDLHEGNVCVKRVRPARPLPSSADAEGRHKFGYSGLEVIILDYTLSRAENIHTGEILAFNLEENQELFYESEMLQHQMYRRMKNWVFFRKQGLSHPLLDDVDTSWDKEREWMGFHPFTNVIWIYYALSFLLKEFKGPKVERERFEEETKELRERVDPDRRAYDGGFGSAREIRAYCVKQGWIREDDTNDMLEDDADAKDLGR